MEPPPILQILIFWKLKTKSSVDWQLMLTKAGSPATPNSIMMLVLLCRERSS